MDYFAELLDRWRSRRRKYYWAPSVIGLTVGIGFLGVAVGLLSWKPDTGTEAAGVRAASLVISGAIGVGLLLFRSFSRTPAHEHEQPWRDQWNQLREGARPFADALDSAYSGWRVQHTVRTEHADRRVTTQNDYPENWRELAKYTRWPDVDETPLKDWKPFLTKRAPEPVRRLYDFLRAVEQLAEIVAFRQYGTDTYERFGLMIETSGFEPFLIDAGVKSTHRDILIALAYLNFAISIRQQWPGKGNGQSGFWSLGARWYPPLLRNPDFTGFPESH